MLIVHVAFIRLHNYHDYRSETKKDSIFKHETFGNKFFGSKANLGLLYSNQALAIASANWLLDVFLGTRSESRPRWSPWDLSNDLQTRERKEILKNVNLLAKSEDGVVWEINVLV